MALPFLHPIHFAGVGGVPGGGEGGGVRVSVYVGWGLGGGRRGGVDRDGVRTWIVVTFVTASIAATASVINCIHSCHSISDQLHP